MGLRWSMDFVKRVFASWSADQVPSLAAALAYYTIFSLCPLIIICLTITGIFLQKEMVEGQLMQQIASLVGAEAAQQIKEMIAFLNKTPKDRFHMIIGLAVLIFGASGLFGQLQTSMNAIWHVKPPKNRSYWKIFKDRFLSITLVLGVAFLLLVSLLLSAALAAVSHYLGNFLPGSTWVKIGFDLIVSISSITLLFSLLFKVLPDVELKWKDVLLGAFITAILFSLGKIVLSFYLATSKVGDAFGAAGAFIIILVWVFYSAQILFLGAEFTKIYTEHKRNGVKTTKGARKASPVRHH